MTQATFDQLCREYTETWAAWDRVGLTDTTVCREMEEGLLSAIRRRYAASAVPMTADDIAEIRAVKREALAADDREDAWHDRQGCD